MIRLRVAIAIFTVFGSATCAYGQGSPPLIKKGDLVYQGAFKAPGFDYGGTAIAYNPANNSLFMVGHVYDQKTAEISIPNIVNSTNLGQLASASIIQPLRDALEGRLQQINPTDPNSQRIGGQLVYGNKLYVSAYSFYDGNGTQRASHFVRPLSLSATGQITGPVRVGNQYPGFVSAYMTLIPPEWRARFGGPALTGNCCQSIISLQSSGPAVSVFNPEDISGGGSVSATPLVGYPSPNILGPGGDTQNNVFSLTSQVTGVIFPDGTRSVLFFGRHGIGPYCYGEASTCGDPAEGGKGTHAYPYVYQVWAYDANQLLEVKNGSRAQHSVTPYAIWNFNLPFEQSNSKREIGGATYDAENKRIFVSQKCTGEWCIPLIHVFKVEIASTPIVPQPPSAVQVQ